MKEESKKSEERAGKVQLIDASKCFEKLRKPLGNKRVEKRIGTDVQDIRVIGKNLQN